MILQALTQYYEDLLALGKIARPGWAKAKVSWALELSDNGELLGLLHLQQEVQRGKKTVLIPQEHPVIFWELMPKASRNEPQNALRLPACCMSRF